MIVTTLSLIVVETWRTLPIVEIAFSIGRATAASSCSGDAPGSVATSDTLGNSMSGMLCMPSRENATRSEEQTSELQSLMRISYAVFCLKKKNTELVHKNRQHSHNINSPTTTTTVI